MSSNWKVRGSLPFTNIDSIRSLLGKAMVKTNDCTRKLLQAPIVGHFCQKLHRVPELLFLGQIEDRLKNILVLRRFFSEIQSDIQKRMDVIDVINPPEDTENILKIIIRQV